jgi:hypothetical protein
MLNNRLSIKLQKAEGNNFTKDLPAVPAVLFNDYENYCKLNSKYLLHI